MPRHERSHLPKKLINPRLPIWLQAILRDHLRLHKSTSYCNKPLPRPISNNKGNFGSLYVFSSCREQICSIYSCNSNGHHPAIDKLVNPCVRAVHRSTYRQWILRGGARGEVERHERCCNGISTANRNVVCKHRQHTDRREIDLLLRVRHPNVLQFLALVESPSCMVLELMPHGSLFDVLQSNRNNLDFGRPATDLPWAWHTGIS
jgi:hypothetical protein